MKTKLILTWVMTVILILMVYGVGCVSEKPPVSHGGPVTDYVSLIDNLRRAGATVEPAGEMTQPFFSVNGRVIVVNGGDVQVFEYADAAAAEAEVALVSPDGSSVGTSMVGWVASPHFYRAEKLIVLYVGDSEAVTNVLESVLGKQFAGRSGGLEDITWILESYGEPESLQTVLDGTEITALFDSAEGQISGSAGANHYFGDYQISKNKLSIREIAHTEMYRLDPEGVMEQEEYYLKTLQAVESYKIEDGKLQITSGTKILIFRDSEEPTVSHGGPVTDYISLIDNLRQAGATVEPAGEMTQPFFSVNGRVIVVNGGDVQVFEYADAAAAEAEAALVSPDGSSIGTSMVGWVASPHFYRAEKLIVLYVGDSEAVTNVLESVLGKQFAGR